MKVLIPFTLDVKKTNVQKIIHANQGEGLDRKLIITLVSGSEPLILDSENQSVQFVANKPDGTTIYNSTAIKDGKVIIYLTSQTTAAVGDVDCQLEVVSTDEESVGSGVVYSAKFTIAVEEALYNAVTVQSSNEFTELIELIERAEKQVTVYQGEGTPSTDPDEFDNIKESDFYYDSTNKTYRYARSVTSTILWESIVNGRELTSIVSDIYAALSDKADKSTTYTKTEVDTALLSKADKSTTYTKTEVDTSLALKADKSTTYTKTETNALLDNKQEKIDSTHKVDADNVNDATSINKFTNASEKNTWNNKYNPEFLVGDEVIYDATGNGLINHNTGAIAPSSSYLYKKKAVLLNETYEIKGVCISYNRQYSALTFLDTNNNVVDYYPKEELETSSFVLKNYIVTITDPRIAYIVVNGGTTTSKNPIIRKTTKLTLDDFVDKKSEYLTKTPAIKDTTELANAEIGLYNWVVNGADTRFTNYVYSSINVEYGETYYVSGITTNTGSQFRVITLLDQNGDVIETYPKENTSGSETYKDLKYIIKNDKAATMIVNGQENTLSIKSGTQVSVEDYVAQVDPNYLVNFVNMADMTKRICASSGKTFNWGALDGGYMTITFDDGYDTLATVSSILQEYDIPFCAAVPPSQLYLPVTGRTIKSMCDEIVENGGEILAHEFSPLTSATDYENIKRIVMDSKAKLTKAGYNVRGLMKPGGAGAISWKNNNLQRFTQMFYDYGDIVGDDPQYYSGSRYSLANSISDLKDKVDDAVANNKWVTLIGHTINSQSTEPTLTEEHLRAFVEYALEQGIKFKTYAYMYDTFGTFE